MSYVPFDDESKPNPGSDKARDLGCLCPVIDNGYGRGYMGGMRDQNGKLIFVMVQDCPIHGFDLTQDSS